MTEQLTEQPQQQTVTIVCSTCQGEYPREQGSRREERKGGIIELGYRCPHCDHWTHGCFLTPELLTHWGRLEVLKQRFQQASSAHSTRFWDEYKKSRQAYSFQFDKTQKHLRLKFGITR